MSALLSLEPADHWTVEQVLHWWLLRSKDETDGSYDQTVERLQKQLDAGMKSLWDDHQQVKALRDRENEDPQRLEEEAEADGTAKGKSGSDLAPGTIRVDIIGGHYAGEVFQLKLTSKASFIGRSQSKKYTKNGISLPHDAEVSTSHGRFVPKNGSFIYIDDGSTNGSSVNGEPIERHVEITMETGMEIVVGATTMQITLPK